MMARVKHLLIQALSELYQVSFLGESVSPVCMHTLAHNQLHVYSQL